MPSIITFNKSCVDREDFKTNHSPYQIVPVHDSFMNDKCINSYELGMFENDILIHASFVSRPFGDKQCETDKGIYNIMQYDRFATKIRSKYILFHGPANTEEYNNFEKGLKCIDKWCNNKIICIEIPAFASSLHNYVKKSGKSCYEFVDSYLEFIAKYASCKDNEIQMVIDTAHLHANGLSGKEMIMLLEKYKECYDFIHMNGNIKDQFKPDVHVQLDSENDKIEQSEYLLSHIVNLDKICVCETKDGEYEYYEDIAKEYGYEIVEKNELYAW